MKTALSFLITAAFLWAAAPSPDVPLGDPVYPFLDQLAVRHGLDLKNLYSRPVSRASVAKLLSLAHLKARDGSLKLSRVEKENLAYFRAEFSFELKSLEPDAPYLERHIYSFNDSALQDYLAVDLGFRDSSEYFGRNGGALTSGCFYGGIRGDVRGMLAFMNRIEVSSEANTDKVYWMSDYNPVNGYPYNTFQDTGWVNKKSWDTFIAGVFFENRLFSAELGVDKLRWGPGEHNALSLSGETPPLGLLKLETDFWKVHYTQSIGILKGERYLDKYMFAHRLEFHLPHGMTAGVNEVLVYGDNAHDGDTSNIGSRFGARSLDYIYGIPFIPYYFSQHFNGDRDNMTLSMDFSARPAPGLKLYMELFLDDMISPLSFFDDQWSNKWAATLGGHYYFPTEKNDLSLLAEYTHVEPWVYTHFFGESHRYRHYGQSLGTSVGPDGDEVYVDLNFKPSRRISLDLSGRNQRQGVGRPGDLITDIHHAADPLTKSFLGGEVRTTRALGLRANLEITRLLNIRIAAEQAFLGSNSLTLSATVDAYW